MSSLRNRKKAKKAKGLFIPNLSGVEGRVTVPEGEYRVKVAEINEKEGNAADYYEWVFAIAEGQFEGQKLFYNTSLAEQALWNLRSLLESLGIEIEDDDMTLDPDDLMDRELMVMVEHEVYEGKKRSRIVDFSPVDGEAEDSDETEEEEPAPKEKKRKSRAERRAERKAKASKKDEDEEEGDEDDSDGDEEEEEEAPKSKKSGKDKKSGKKGKDKKKSDLSREAVLDMSEDELEEVVEEHELDVDLSDYSTLRKKKNAVIDALEDADLI